MDNSPSETESSGRWGRIKWKLISH